MEKLKIRWNFIVAYQSSNFGQYGVLSSDISDNILKTRVLISLEFYCLWGSTKSKLKIFFFDILKIGVLLSLEFFCFWSSSVFGVLRSPYLNDDTEFPVGILYDLAWHTRGKLQQMALGYFICVPGKKITCNFMQFFTCITAQIFHLYVALHVALHVL